MLKENIQILCERKYCNNNEHDYAHEVANNIYSDFSYICEELEDAPIENKKLALKCLINEYFSGGDCDENVRGDLKILESISNSKTLILEDGVPNTALRGAVNLSNDGTDPESNMLGMVAGGIGAFSALKPGVNYLRNSIKDTKKGSRLRKKAARGRKYEREIANASRALKKGSVSTAVKTGGGSKTGVMMLKAVEKLFPKYSAKAAKVLAKMGPKGLKAFMVGATAGTWIIVEIIIFLISKGGIAFLKSDNSIAKNLVKQSINFMKSHPNWTKFINVCYTLFAYGDLKKTILLRGIELGYITQEEASKIDDDSSVFGGEDYSNINATETDSLNQNANSDSVEQGDNSIDSTNNIQVPEDKPGDESVAKPVSKQENELTIRQAFKDIATVRDRGGWIVGARKAGWPEEKIEKYRKIINQYYKNKKMNKVSVNEERLKEIIKEEIISELNWGGLSRFGRSAWSRASEKGSAIGDKLLGRFRKPNQDINKATGEISKNFDKITSKSAEATVLKDAMKLITRDIERISGEISKMGKEIAVYEEKIKTRSASDLKKNVGAISAMETALNKKRNELLKLVNEMNTKKLELTTAKGSAEKVSSEILALQREQEMALALIDDANKLKCKNAKIMSEISAALGVSVGTLFGVGITKINQKTNEPETPPTQVPGNGGPVEKPGDISTPPADTSTPPSDKKKKQKKSDVRVLKMQRKLNMNGWANPELKGDGILGPKTISAARLAGIDPNTWQPGDKMQVNPNQANSFENGYTKVSNPVKREDLKLNVSDKPEAGEIKVRPRAEVSERMLREAIRKEIRNMLK